ncbi:hypothetical protein BS78_03G185700 [Paspalum vaginatum]|nr:hypothetical protein BS78_03G185700 [Paspalum vaginatum]
MAGSVAALNAAPLAALLPLPIGETSFEDKKRVLVGGSAGTAGADELCEMARQQMHWPFLGPIMRSTVS